MLDFEPDWKAGRQTEEESWDEKTVDPLKSKLTLAPLLQSEEHTEDINIVREVMVLIMFC